MPRTFIWRLMFWFLTASYFIIWFTRSATFSRILEISEIGVPNILQNPGNIGNIGNLIFPIFPYPGNTGNMLFFFFYILGFLQKKTRAEISRRMVRFSRRDLSYETNSGPKTKTVSDPNFQVTAAATTFQQLSHLARALNHHAQGPNIPFGVIPHFDIYIYIYTYIKRHCLRNIFY